MSNRKIDYKRLALVIAIPVFIIVLLIIIVMMIMNSFSTKLNVLPEVRMEVGETIILEPSLFMDSSRSSEDIDKVNMSSKLLKNDNLYSFNQNTNEITSKGKKYLEVGIYPITFKLGNREEESKLVVEDTKAPEITEVAGDHRTKLGTTSFDYTSLVDIFDYSEFEVNINSSSVDLNTEGRYPVVFTAKDEYGNTSNLSVDLLVGNADYSALVEQKEKPAVIPGYATEDDNDIDIDNFDSFDSGYEDDTSNKSSDYKDFWDKLYNTKEDTKKDNSKDWGDNSKDWGDNSKDWREKYKEETGEKSSNSETKIEGVSTTTDSQGRVSTLTAPSTKEADAYIQANIAGKMKVSWTIEDVEGGVKYAFSY